MLPQIRTRKVRTLRSRNGLISFARDTTSQNGEDGIIAEIFRNLPPLTRSTKLKRWCVDVGAWDGKHLSNTYSLLVNNPEAWSGILIEADPARTADLQQLHLPLNNICVTCNVSCENIGSPNSLPSILKKSNPLLPKSFDFISIDVDGTDYWLMSDLLQHYTPHVICCEFNPTIPNDIIYIQPRSDNIRHGSSLAALVELGTSMGYRLIETTVFNAFFVPMALYMAHFQTLVPDTSIEVLHETTMGTKMYQLYDGSLKLSGCKKLLWHRKRIEEANIQVLTPQQRIFPFQPPSSSSTTNTMTETEVASLVEASIDLSKVSETDLFSFGDETCGDKAAGEIRLEINDQITKLWNTLAKDGFAFISGTGMAHQLCRESLDLAAEYFTASEKVRRSSMAKDRARRGYSPMNSENFASLVGAKAPNDCVRKFRIGNTTKCQDEATSGSLHQSNAWPNQHLWEHADRFQEVVTQYYNCLREVGVKIVSMITEGMRRHGFEENAKQIMNSTTSISSSTSSSIDSVIPSTRTTDILTLLGYQRKKKSARKGQARPLVAAHTDVGVVTVLLYEPEGDCAKLQRNDGKDGWIDVKLPRLSENPMFVVNIGDCLSDMTNGTLRSTLHRVVPVSHSESSHQRRRQCLAMFVGLNSDVMLHFDRKEECSDGEDTCTTKQSITYEEWRFQRIKRAQSVLKNVK